MTEAFDEAKEQMLELLAAKNIKVIFKKYFTLGLIKQSDGSKCPSPVWHQTSGY